MIKKLKHKFVTDVHFTDLLKGSSVAFILKIIGMGVGYLSVLFITNKYGAANYGILVLSTTVLYIFALFPKFGMDVAVVRIIGEIREQNADLLFGTYKKIFIFVFILSIFSSILLYFLAHFIANTMIHKIFMYQYLEIISVSLISTVGISVLAAYFQAIRNIKVFVFLQTVLHQMIFISLLLLNNYLINVSDNLVLLYVIANIIAFFISIIITSYDLSKYRLIGKTANLSMNLKEIIYIAFPMLFASSFALLMNWTDIIMLGIFTGENEVGVYASAQRMASLTGLGLIAINSIAAPKFIDFYSKKDMFGLQRIAQQSTKFIFFSSFPLLVIFFTFPEFIMGFFGDEFLKGDTTLMILTLGQFVNAASGSVGYIMQMTDNQKIYRNIIMVAALFNVALNYILIPLYGMEGAAFASVISMIFWNLSLVYIIKKRLGFLTFFVPYIK
jgi:O-antigen/teichoic acid export membrane protein